MDLDYTIFKNPPLDFYLCPWWCWNGEMEDEEIIYQLRQFKEHGIPQVFIAPYYGLDFPYLSETFWKKYEVAVKEAEKLGMKIWLYDEYCWPSGNAGGLLLRDEPWTRGKALAVSLFTVPSGEELNTFVEGKVLALRAFGKNETVLDVKDYKVNQEGEISSIIWKNVTNEDYKLLVFATRTTKVKHAFSYGSPWTWDQQGYVDTLNPKAVRRFIELVHEEYEKRFDKYFGTIIPGIFTDEVHMVSPDPKDPEKWYFPYTEGLLEFFKRTKGYDLLPKIHELVLQVGDFIRTRYDYWSHVHEVYTRSYYKQVSDWCAYHKINLTGHPLAEEYLSTFWTGGGDVWHQVKYMQYPGQDRLGLSTGYDDPRKDHEWLRTDPRAIAIGSKIVCSSAKFTGAKRVLSETFGLIPWYCTLEDKKRVIDWLCSMGINLINDNKHQYSIRGFRKRYYSHGIYFSMPYFKHYNLFSEYVARLCLMAASGGEGTEVAILYPSTTAWTMYDAADEPRGIFSLAEESLRQATDALMREQWASDYVFEEILEKAEIKEGTIRYQDLIYKALIIPAAYVLPEKVLEKIATYAKQGGTLIFLNLLPNATPEGRVNVSKIIKDITGLEPLEHNVKVLQIWNNGERKRDIHEVERKDNVIVITHLADPLKLEVKLSNLLEEKLRRYVKILNTKPSLAKRNFVSCHRRSKEIDFFFVSNLNRENVEATIKLKAKGSPQIWDLEDGSIRPIQASQDEDGVLLNYVFPRSGSALFAIGKETENIECNVSASSLKTSEKQIILSDKWLFSTKTPNICRLRLQALVCNNDEEKENIIRGSDNAGNWIPLNDGIFLPEGLKLKSAEYWWLRARVTLDIPPKGIMLVVDDKNYDKVYVNGKRVKCSGRINVWDSGNRRYELDNYLKFGENIIVVGVSFPKWWSERVAPRQAMDPVVLIGHFEVYEENGIQRLKRCEEMKKIGSWHEQGYPYYSGTGVYEQTIVLPKISGRVFLKIEEVKETVEVFVNGNYAGTRIWPPFKVEITDFLKEGQNTITLEVSNTLENLFEKPYPSGLTGYVKLLYYEDN